MFYPRASICSLSAAAVTVWLGATPALAGSWKTNVNYGSTGNPTMDLFIPSKPKSPAGLVLAIHYCGGNAGATHGWYDASGSSLAEKYGFYVISPNAGNNCWDSSPGRSGEKAAIVKMIDYVKKNYTIDEKRVFSSGASSGACMTNTLMASYPEVFAGGSVLAGVPVGAWPAGNTSCSGVCNTTPPTKTAQQWGDLVRNADPGFTGSRPRLQLFHGSSDEYLYYPYLAEEVKQWTNALGLDESAGVKESNKPLSGWERTSYKDDSGTVMLEVNTKQGEKHDLTGKGLFPDVVRFFGLDQDPPDAGAGGDDAALTGTGGAQGSDGGGGKDGGLKDGGKKDADNPGNGGAGGGGSSASGGSTGSGGTSGKGGSSGTGGSNSGGAQGVGGKPGTGGAVGTGGSGSGGSTPSSSGKGGSSGTGGGGGGGGGSSGCSYTMGGHGHTGWALAMVLAALALGLRRRKR